MSAYAGGAAGRPLCPSAPAAQGAALIGLVQPDGHVENLTTALPVDQNFIDHARPHGPLEQRFRFAAPCQSSKCGHWTGQQCGLIGSILDHRGTHAAAQLQPCAIRNICRWWDQEGPTACAACTLVVTDTRSGG